MHEQEFIVVIIGKIPSNKCRVNTDTPGVLMIICSLFRKNNSQRSIIIACVVFMIRKDSIMISRFDWSIRDDSTTSRRNNDKITCGSSCPSIKIKLVIVGPIIKNRGSIIVFPIYMSGLVYISTSFSIHRSLHDSVETWSLNRQHQFLFL